VNVFAAAAGLRPFEAFETLVRFAGARGEAALRLAMHTAVPQSFRPDLLHLLKLNFVPEAAEDTAVEADVLLAPFSQELGGGYFVFEVEVRRLLLEYLGQVYASEPLHRVHQVADFLLRFVEHAERRSHAADRLGREFLETQRWVGLAFSQPEAAAAQLASALESAEQNPVLTAQLNLSGVAHAMSIPLARYRALLIYATGLDALHSGDDDDARELLEPLADTEIVVGSITLSPRNLLGDDRLGGGISIHIGVNAPARRSPSPLALLHSEDAARKMAELASQAGYRTIHVLCGADATREALNYQLASATQTLRAGQTLFVSFSGHGTKIRDIHGDERDGFDEAWCLYDGIMVDDDLTGYWKLLDPGVRLCVVTDSSFGGGMGSLGESVYRSAGWDAWRGVAQTEMPGTPLTMIAPAHDDGIQASVLVLAAAREDQHARDGLYTRHLLAVWDGGRFRGSFLDLHRIVRDRVVAETPGQEPQILMLGAADPSFPLEVAFHLDRSVMRGRPERF
jgi:hypothetical protein